MRMMTLPSLLLLLLLISSSSAQSPPRSQLLLLSDVVIDDPHVLNAKFLNGHYDIEVRSCLNIDDLNSPKNKVKTLIVSCDKLEQNLEIDRFLKNGGNMLSLNTKQHNLMMAKDFGIQQHQFSAGEDKLHELSLHKVFSQSQIATDATTQPQDRYLTYDSKNIVLFDILALHGQFYLDGSTFSPKSFLLGAQLRNGVSKVAFSIWSLDEISAATLNTLLDWMSQSDHLPLLECNVVCEGGKKLEFGEDKLNHHCDTESIEYIFEVPKKFTHLSALKALEARIRVDFVEIVLMDKTVAGKVSSDGSRIAFRVDAKININRMSTRFVFSLFQEGILNFHLEQNLLSQPKPYSDKFQFEGVDLNIYVAYFCIVLSMFLFIYTWLLQSQ